MTEAREIFRAGELAAQLYHVIEREEISTATGRELTEEDNASIFDVYDDFPPSPRSQELSEAENFLCRAPADSDPEPFFPKSEAMFFWLMTWARKTLVPKSEATFFLLMAWARKTKILSLSLSSAFAPRAWAGGRTAAAPATN